MKIKKNAFSTLVLELLFPSIANCRKLKIQKNPKIDFPYCACIVYGSYLPAMDRFSDFSATREIAEISVHHHNIRGGLREYCIYIS
jgi:hypothetical protein